MDPTCGLGGKVRDFVLKLIWEQILYLFCYERNIDQLNEQLMKLILERTSVQHQIDEAKNNGEQIEEKVIHWLGEVDELSEQVQKFHEESQAKTGCNITSCPNPWLRYILSKRAETIAQEAVKIYEKINFNRFSYRVPPQSLAELTSRESNKGINSRVQIMNQVLEELRNAKVNMIGLFGLGGVGKTTLAKDIEKEVKNQKIFEKVMMATVSKEMNIGQIQNQIIEKLGMQLNERTENVKASRLCERLKQEKNMLLILDDLWEELDLDEVGIPLFSVEGCKILLTARSKALLSDDMKCQTTIEVGDLSEEEALELFKKIAELTTNSSSPELISIATNIVQKCRGLPLAIATAAKALRNKDIDVWRDALALLNNPVSNNIMSTSKVDTILKLSYDHLSSSEQKNIFLLAAMLSHDPSIEDLLIYSMGLDILYRENLEGVHVGVSAIVSQLKSLNLFLDSFSSHHVRIHDVFRDVALRIASNEGLNLCPIELHVFISRRLKEWPDESMLQRFEGICIQESDISELPEELHCPRLQFFMLNNTKQDLNIPNMFFECSKELKVLAFTNVHFSSLSSLIFLHKLKALCLHSCLLDDITEVRSLKNLKVLSFAYSEIQRLPIELAELTSLQMLNLSHCSNLKEIPQKLLSSFKKLEALLMGNSFHQWNVEGYSEADENASLDELIDLPISSLDIHIPNISMLPENLFLDMNLKRYKLSIGGEDREWGENCKTSKILTLQLRSSIHLRYGVPKLLEGVEDLYLNGCNAQENVLHSHEGRGFPHLRHLQMYGPYGFVSGAVRRYPDMFDPDMFHHRSTKDNVSNKTLKSLFNSKVSLPKLEILVLYELSKTLLIWDDQPSHNSFNNLKELLVLGCGFVKLVPLHVLKSLNNLKEVEVGFCDMLEIMFDFEDLNDYHKEMDSSSVVVLLEKLKLRNLPQLKNVWSDHYQGNISFPSLKSVDVYECESLTNIFPASIAKGMLCHLEELKIVQCGVDVIVAKDQVSEPVSVTFEFPRLTSLRLSSLPNLRNFYSQKHTLEWPLLNQLFIKCCDELEIFEKEVSSSSEIYEEQNMLDSKYPLLSHDKVCGNLERLTLQVKEVQKFGIGQLLMYHFPKLKLLCLNPTFWVEGPLNLAELHLGGDFEKVLGGDNVAALVARFSKLTLEEISIMGSLSPSLVSSQNLTHLEVDWCNQWTTLMTSSIARSLVHLTHLSISSCDQIEEIITNQEGEDDEDKEIFFKKLEFLKLKYLERLRRFCRHNYTFRFPFLEHVTIEGCPRLTMFCPGSIHAPQLQSIQVYNFEVDRHIWLTDLNDTIQHLFTFKEVISTIGSMAINAKNITRIVDVFPKVSHLYVESFTDEGVTFPYSSLEKFPKLDWLEVEHCSFEEIFPSQDQIIDFMGKIPPFDMLHIAYMDKLKSIWKDDSHLPPIHQNINFLRIKSCCSLVKLAPSSTSFQDLRELDVSGCHQLIHLVTTSTAKSLVSLAWLEINDCKRMEEIVMNDTNEDVQAGITFNELYFIKLTNMPSLKMFSSQSHTFEFPKLKKIEISGCPEMKKFYPGVENTEVV